jgi:Prp8 binding protein
LLLWQQTFASPYLSRTMSVVPVAKRARVDNAVALYDSKDKQIVVAGSGAPARTSDLEAPTMLLSGHGASVLTMKFDPSGKFMASGSFDRHIFLWEVYGECTNYMMLTGSKNAVLELHWNYDGSQIVSCSADKMVSVWDAEMGQRVKKLSGHTGVVNSCCNVRRGPPILVSGSDDGTIKVT